MLFAPAELMGAWLGGCFFYISLDLGESQYTYVILYLFIRLFQYIRIPAQSLLSFILCILFCTNGPFPRAMYSCMQIPTENQIDLLTVGLTSIWLTRPFPQKQPEFGGSLDFVVYIFIGRIGPCSTNLYYS